MRSASVTGGLKLNFKCFPACSSGFRVLCLIKLRKVYSCAFKRGDYRSVSDGTGRLPTWYVLGKEQSVPSRPAVQGRLFQLQCFLPLAFRMLSLMTELIVAVLSPGCKNYNLLYFLLPVLPANSESVLRGPPHC